MTKAKFEIRKYEKHTVIVNVNTLLKYTTVEVDGKKVVNESHFSSLPKKFQVEVINTEKNFARAGGKYLDLDTKNGGESND